MYGNYTFKALEQATSAAGGLREVTMEHLRDCVGAGKLGRHVLDEIDTGLRRNGLAVLGGRLPNDHRNTVWLIARSSTYGEMLLDLVALMRKDAGAHGEAARWPPNPDPAGRGPS